MPYSQQLDIRGKMARRGLMLAAGTIAYAALMGDDEAYKRATPEERLANWFLYVPGIDEPVRVPIPFEMGFLFKALPEAVYNMATQDDKADAAIKGLGRLAFQTVPLSLPQAVKPITEAILGKSFYSGDIESAREKDVLATQRYRDNSTELAKTITELLFGDESAYIRFDMSEFSAEHSDQRLIGAPPGYVGYDTGGELTNAIREKPFSVVLFDEIEKAHPRILDKFLQVLDDGVLTSGRGERVYFSEAFLIFTSNLGIYCRDSSGERVANTTQDDDFEMVERKVSSEIDRYFKLELGRPEILNRIGENIIVFDFIRPEVADQIFSMMVQAILERVEQATGRLVQLTDPVRMRLREICHSDLSDGGRGIRNQLEAHLVNPLARLLFDHPGEGPLLIDTVNMERGLTVLHTALGGES
jgi:hypothetical protein